MMIDRANHTVLSFCSSENKQFSIFEKLRTQLSSFWIQNKKLTQLPEDLESKYNNMCRAFIEDLFEYNKTNDISDHLSTY